MDDPSSTLATTTATASTTTHAKLVLSSNRNDNEILSSFLSSAFKTTTASKLVEVGDTIVCKRSIPTLGILENSSHVVTSIYTQYFDEETQQIVKIPLNNLPLDAGDYGGIVVAGDQRQGRSSSSNSKVVYMTLFVQPSDYTNNRVGEAEGGTNVIVTPEEVGLVSVQNELGNAIWLAVPGLFWVGVATSFYNTYHERTGGSLEDAFWGR
jgi:hypothetical protein